MAKEIRIWQIEDDLNLKELNRSNLNLEKRLENWIEKDVSILADNLLVIGRQVDTDFGGVVDLLCLDANGDLVIVELKRDKTPRKVIAQVLDYGAWVQDLPNDRIRKIADKYLGSEGALEKAFREKFATELPDVLNENHSMLIVASDIDPTSERIIKYLSDNYGVSINAITFQYFQSDQGDELLARVFLLKPSQVEYKTQSRIGAKRRPNLSFEELEKIADNNGVGNLYKRLVSVLDTYFGKSSTRSSVAFYGNFNDGQKATKVILSLSPPASSAESGLKFRVYSWRMSEYFNTTEDAIRALLPEQVEPWRYTEGVGKDMSGYEGFFNMEEVDRFLAGLKELAQKL